MLQGPSRTETGVLFATATDLGSQELPIAWRSMWSPDMDIAMVKVSWPFCVLLPGSRLSACCSVHCGRAHQSTPVSYMFQM